MPILTMIALNISPVLCDGTASIENEILKKKTTKPKIKLKKPQV